MKFLHILSTLALGAACPCVNAQSAVILGTDQAFSWPPQLAPGQVVTLWVTGLTPTETLGAKAMSTPFPTTLAGISAMMTQNGGPTLPPLPIIAVTPPGGSCLAAPCTTVIGVTVQIPYQLNPNFPGCLGCTHFAQIVVSDSTNKTMGLGITPVPDRIHVLGVTHADGSPVTQSNPALVGEVIVMYASGLGFPTSLSSPFDITTGDVTPSPAPLAAGALSYDYRVNASPSQAKLTTSDPYRRFLGMSPGSVGLYNANFVVPPPPAGLPECDGISVFSNLTVTLVGATSFDGSAVCIKNPGP